VIVRCREKIVVNKPRITLTGASARATVITWNEQWLSADSPTVSVLASDFVAKRLTFQVRSFPFVPAHERTRARADRRFAV
jgi:pectinesterase